MIRYTFISFNWLYISNYSYVQFSEMSEVLTALQCATTTATIPAPQTRGRPSLARKRPAAAGLRPLSEVSVSCIFKNNFPLQD